MKITSREELEIHIAAHKGRNIPLFSGIGKMHSNYMCIVHDETIKSHHAVTIEDHSLLGTPFIHIDGIPFYSLNDRHCNGPQDYNDNWWFTTEQEAKEYSGATEK